MTAGSGPLCGAPTAKGTPCRRLAGPAGCGTHPRQPAASAGGGSMLAAVERLLVSLDLGAEGEMHAAQARHLAAVLDAGDTPGYSVAALHRELRTSAAALLGSPTTPAGLTDDDIRQLLGHGPG